VLDRSSRDDLVDVQADAFGRSRGEVGLESDAASGQRVYYRDDAVERAGGLMVRLADLPPELAEAYRRLPLPSFESTPWTPPPPLREARIAIVTTAGLHRKEDARFAGGAADYRIIPGDIEPATLVMSHGSVNFDRSGFQQDVNVVFPLDLLRELAAAGEIGSVAAWHYSFMGATDPTRMQDAGREVGRLLRQDGVTGALLVPV
jgi:D-proline reductase (dithiol) PrdB